MQGGAVTWRSPLLIASPLAGFGLTWSLANFRFSTLYSHRRSVNVDPWRSMNLPGEYHVGPGIFSFE
jgi:hypothetical protein